MDVSSIAIAYTAFSEVLVGFAWGTQSHSGNGTRRRRASRNQAGERYRRSLATWWPLSHATRRYRSAGRAGHDNGQT